jgi:hypothetical protein
MVLSVGKPGGFFFPVSVPLISAGRKPSCAGGSGGGGGTWRQLLWAWCTVAPHLRVRGGLQEEGAVLAD